MLVPTIATAVLVALSLFGCIIAVRKRDARQIRNKAAVKQAAHEAKVAELMRLIAAVESGDLTALETVCGRGDLWTSHWSTFARSLDDPSIAARLQTAAEDLRAKHAFNTHIDRMTELYYACFAGGLSTREREAAVAAYIKEFNGCSHGYKLIGQALMTSSAANSMLNGLITNACNELAARAHNGDRDAFTELLLLIMQTRQNASDHAHPWPQATVQPLRWPKDWHEIVDEFLIVPDIKHLDIDSILREHRLGRTPGCISVLASVAVKTKDRFLAKAVIALCNHNPAYRTGLGDLIWSNVCYLAAEQLLSQPEPADEKQN